MRGPAVPRATTGDRQASRSSSETFPGSPQHGAAGATDKSLLKGSVVPKAPVSPHYYFIP